ncbi:HNH endonuclease signature motif containing protein [Kineosporia sp. R_H_3]|uniref:HNH endonuclease signature motif containing protein n=1 Tax=Kineosporia sp. R_H_3 TaxID=1961848 RepID=UPI000B4BD858|nr:HNH endonuclease signature motif containing protein [Kineosporia sp. R_H_3]
MSIQTADDGAALFTAVGPGEAITAAYNGLDAAARYLRRHGDPRTLDQLRHDLFVTGCTSGYLPVPADVLPVPPGCVPDDGTAPAATAPVPETGTFGTDSGPSENGDDESAPAWFTSTWPDVQVTVNVTVSAETLMGLVDDPGTLQGYGPIPADAIRDLVTNGVFRCVVVEGEHGTVLGVGKSTYTPGYVASERLKLLVEHAYPTCTGPNCGKAAWRCDLDHQTPYGHGGATCECNTRPLCRACHRLKTAGLLVPQQRHHPGDPPGTTLWTTRTGRTWTVLPHAPLPPRSAVQVASDGATRRPVPAATADEPPPF